MQQKRSSLQEYVTAHRDDVIGVVQLMLNACAEGFQLQRGNIFGFSDYDKNSPDLITNHDIEKLLFHISILSKYDSTAN